jgi:hypothetical protein
MDSLYVRSSGHIDVFPVAQTRQGAKYSWVVLHVSALLRQECRDDGGRSISAAQS